MIKIRLTRTGRKKHVSYRIVVADSRRARDGRCIEQIGWYQPLNDHEEKNYKLDEDRALYWLKAGAAPSDTVRSLLRQSGLMQKYHDLKVEQAKARKENRAAKTAE
ncbi:30S ribosomal protein S16 [Candidatus Sumerlaeota bacterium]|nr:30S ribosomal protein S16 [Candidatus Sumerlaeota bacterium]